MSRRRRAFALIGLALVLGGLALSEMSRREAAVREQLAPIVAVLVARKDLPVGQQLVSEDLAIRQVPERYAPPDARIPPEAVVGSKLAASIPVGGYVGSGQIAVEPDVARPDVGTGERAVEVLGKGPSKLIVPGARIDVLVTRDGDYDGGRQGTELALENVEVLASAPAKIEDGESNNDRVVATLRVRVDDAVYLTAAQSFAKEVRLLPRPEGDRKRRGAVTIGPGLR